MANLSNINNKFLVTTGGDVGINTTSPDARLHVNGTTFLEGTFGNPNTDAAYRIKFYDNGGVYNDAGIGLDGSGGGSEKMWFNAYSGFYWNEGTKGIKMMLDGTGRLGIGTDLPSSLLTLNATSGGALQWQYNGGNYLRIEADSGGGSYYAAAGFYHRFFTSGLERMRITSAGQVNITKGSSGTVLYLDGVNAYNAETGIQLSAGRAKISGFLNATGGTPGSSLRFYTMPDGGSVTERMRITSSAEGHIELLGTAPTIKATASNGASGLRINIAGQSSGQLFRVQEDGSTLFQIDNSGNIGIGTTSPSGLTNGVSSVSLGGTHTSTSGGLFYQVNGTYKAYSFVSSNEFVHRAQSGVSQVFWAGAVERMRIKSNGIIEARADISSYTNMSTAFAAYGDTDSGEYGIALNTAGDGLSGSIASNLIYSDGTITQPNSARSSGEIRFSNTTAASQTADIQFGGYYKGTTTFLERMRLTNVGDLHVDGDVVAYSTTISDKRLKDNVKPLESSLDKVMNLKGVEYVWNNGSRKGQKDIGFIAQEVEEVIPEIVREKQVIFNKEEKYKTVDYRKNYSSISRSCKRIKSRSRRT